MHIVMDCVLYAEDDSEINVTGSFYESSVCFEDLSAYDEQRRPVDLSTAQEKEAREELWSLLQIKCDKIIKMDED